MVDPKFEKEDRDIGGEKNFNRVTGDEGIGTSNLRDKDLEDDPVTKNADATRKGSMNAPGHDDKDTGMQQKPDINKTPLV